MGHSHFVMLRRQLTLRLLSFLLGGGSAAWGQAALHTAVVYPHPLDRLVKCGQGHLPHKMAGLSMKAHVTAPVPTEQPSSKYLLTLNFLYVLTVTSLSNNNDQPKQKRTSQHAHTTIPLSPQFCIFYHSKRQEKKEPSSEPVIYSQLHGGLSGSPPRLTPCG